MSHPGRENAPFPGHTSGHHRSLIKKVAIASYELEMNSDLLSDVMVHAPAGSVLITIQAHNNTIAVASLAGVNGILICNSRPVPADMIASERKERIAIFRISRNQFQVSCLIGSLLVG